MEPLLYVALGDSITGGTNVPKHMRFPTVLGQMIERHVLYPVYVHNMGKRGLTSTGLLHMLKTPSVLDAIHHADFVTVCIGGDDLIYAYVKWRLFRSSTYVYKAIHQLLHNLELICHILAYCRPKRIAVGTFYNPFPKTPLAREVVQFAADGVIRPTAAHSGFPIADLYRVFLDREAELIDHFHTGGLEDYRPFTPNTPIHPNIQGYGVIAQTFFDKLV